MAAGLLEEADLDGRADDLARPDRPAGRVGQRARGRREPAAGPAFDALRRRRGGGGRGGGRPEGVVVGVREEEVAPLEGGRRRGEGEEGDRVGERGRQDERRGRGHRCCCCGGVRDGCMRSLPWVVRPPLGVTHAPYSFGRACVTPTLFLRPPRSKRHRQVEPEMPGPFPPRSPLRPFFPTLRRPPTAPPLVSRPLPSASLGVGGGEGTVVGRLALSAASVCE
jgi:hypothetical protein